MAPVSQDAQVGPVGVHDGDLLRPAGPGRKGQISAIGRPRGVLPPVLGQLNGARAVCLNGENLEDPPNGPLKGNPVPPGGPGGRGVVVSLEGQAFGVGPSRSMM
jgi:hypothetical protein